MRVLHVLGTGKPGGVESFVLGLVQDTPRAEAEISVCIVGEDGPVSEALREAGATVNLLRGAGAGRFAEAVTFRRMLGAGSFDLVHANSGGRVVRLLARRAGAIVLSHLHGLEQEWLPDVHTRGQGLHKRVAVLAAGADEVAVSSEWMDRLMVDGGCRKPIIRLRYGVDEVRFSPEERDRLRDESRHAIGSTVETKIVGFVGRLVEQKGPQHLLNLATALADQDVIVAIVGDGAARSTLETRILEVGLNNVRFLGEQIDTRRAMAAFDVTIMPSEWEPFGIVALESSAMGIPVVAFNTGGISEAVEHGESGLLVPPGDAEALVHDVRRLLGDVDLCRSLGAKGRARVERTFRRSAASAAVISHYRELLARSAESRRTKSTIS